MPRGDQPSLPLLPQNELTDNRVMAVLLRLIGQNRAKVSVMLLGAISLKTGHAKTRVALGTE